MTADPNIFACLVHESQECVIDLVRNLRTLDPDSLVLLYNGGRDPQLLRSGFPFERYGAVVHPHPQPVAWGHLHPFALDCMQFALEHIPFRTLTIVDSDQLALRSGYSAYLNSFLSSRENAGMLGNCPAVQPHRARIPPAQTAHQEIELWRPFLRRFPQGENKFVHWSFWPSTVFTASAAGDLVRIFANDPMLQSIMSRTKIWASEEVILPTLVALLGYEILDSPCSYHCVQYRQRYSVQNIKDAASRRDVFWVHPVPRVYDDPLRTFIRQNHQQYSSAFKQEVSMTAPQNQSASGLLLTWPILTRMRQIEGWLADDEADLLIAASSLALADLPEPHNLVEVGSYCGRSTVVLGSVLKSARRDAKLFAIDPHDGKVGAVGQGIQVLPPTLEKLKHNLAAANLTDFVTIITQRSWEVAWDKPISFLFIDGLHDYANVARDFFHFERWLVPGAYIAFHDYANYYQGVQTFVDELLRTARYEKVHCSSSMLVMRRAVGTEQAVPAGADHSVRFDPPQPAAEPAVQVESQVREVNSEPLVSCIMPTADRPGLVPQAITYFLRQTYANRELIILDDGAQSVQDLIPQDPRILYVRMPERRTMGEKHNMACEMAKGEIIAHWDDDDWMADRRLSYQVRELLRHPPMTLIGLSRLMYYDPRAERAWEYVYPAGQRPWVCGNTFCYRKPFWEKFPFPSRNEGADTMWVWGLKNAAICALPDHTFYISIIHSKNTSPKRTNQPRWHPFSTQEISNLMRDDLAFYADISKRL